MDKHPTIENLLEKMTAYTNQSNLDLVRLAYDFAEKAHAGQTRKSGEPYIIHPLSTAMILTDMRIDPIIICAALLHDVPEDTNVTLEELNKNFGPEIASIVEGITKLGKLKYRGVERYIENLRKMFIAMAEDIRVMIVKFADRIHNLMTLDALPPPKQYRIALESLEIYAPIANRLGIGEMKGMLEDLAFKYIYPKEYEATILLKETKLKDKEQLLKNVQEQAKNEIGEAGIKIIDLHGREKKMYSLYQKMQRKDNDVAKIYDLVALRIIVPTIADCYASLGVIHKIWKPLKGRIKDYIAQPKPNGYRSLHTTVFVEDGEVVEFQIRTPEMHEEAEYGVAAHWHYDEFGARLPKKEIRWVKELADIQKNILNRLSDLEEIKVDFLQSRIFVFTPKGDVIDLPEGATPIDFAYHIHTDVGDKCVGAMINDQLTSLDTELRNGDVVEIIIDKNRKGPAQDWLKFVKTNTAKSHVKNYIKNKHSKLSDFFKYIKPGK
ncbi:MAG: (P)ppGpp synthetase I, SpoT/RelA [Candidatus Magasanikbacteria bacterium GW2011_GWC2_37_14]|uniref:(P)ppGpp synthetase I, SpoT/RelA n=1 Tax=Candidatus Magasanikbacteria bacterium GW2011_GWC2_37_14 TaxID=1619046 RepID=A0A0G0GLX9_9BACT|nr:MAG: (P)ppGpp synthetase I, SpoT/RelA [Candidatus Magasanikbacteria bacterium GW2011_GWC2_37_14]